MIRSSSGPTYHQFSWKAQWVGQQLHRWRLRPCRACRVRRRAGGLCHFQGNAPAPASKRPGEQGSEQAFLATLEEIRKDLRQECLLPLLGPRRVQQCQELQNGLPALLALIEDVFRSKVGAARGHVLFCRCLGKSSSNKRKHLIGPVPYTLSELPRFARAPLI